MQSVPCAVASLARFVSGGVDPVSLNLLCLALCLMQILSAEKCAAKG